MTAFPSFVLQSFYTSCNGKLNILVIIDFVFMLAHDLAPYGARPSADWSWNVIEAAMTAFVGEGPVGI